MKTLRLLPYLACTAAGMLVGTLLANQWQTPVVEATATSERDDLLIATGPVDGDGEALFILDTLTGDLKAYTMHPRLAKFTGFFQTNVLKDLQITNPKRARFTMVTGLQRFRRGPGVAQLADTVLYVAELSTGRMVAYGMPWNRAFRTSAQGPNAALIPLDGRQFRQVQIRD